MATPGEAFLARDPRFGHLVLCGPSSELPAEDASKYAPPASIAKGILRNGQPFHPDRFASIMGFDFTQQQAYDLLERLLWMRSSIETVLSHIEKHKDTPTTDVNPCVDMLDDEVFKTDSELTIMTEDIICARHSAVVKGLSYMLTTENEDGEERLPLWPVVWKDDFLSISTDFVENHPVPLCDPSDEGLEDAYKALFLDVEWAVSLMTLGLGTEELWYDMDYPDYDVPSTPVPDESILPPSASFPSVVEAMLNGIVLSDVPSHITILGESIPTSEALKILRYLLSIRYSLDIILHLNISGTFKVVHPYNYLGDTMPVALATAIHAPELVSEDRIATRHTAITSNLESLLEVLKPDPNAPARSLWPDTSTFRERFPSITHSKYNNVFRTPRNGFAHTYATPKATTPFYENVLFACRMKGEYEALRENVVVAVGLFEEALRTQKVVRMEE